MANLVLNINISEIMGTLKDTEGKARKALEEGVKALASMTHAKTMEYASEELKSTSVKFRKALSFQQVAPNTYVVSLDESMLFIEDGRKCIVYGKSLDHTPEILTLEGSKPITQVKIGEMVLNQEGKWTKIKEIYDEHLVEKSKMIHFVIRQSNYCPENKKLHKRECILFHQLSCPTCGFSKKLVKLKNREFNTQYCDRCFEAQKIVKITIGTGLDRANKKTTSPKTIFFTSDHKIKTNLGWVEAGDLIKGVHKLLVPSWSNCKECNKPTFLGSEFCQTNYGGSPCKHKDTQRKILAEGKHVSQREDFMATIYLKTLRRGSTMSGAEDAFAKLIEKYGLTTGFGEEFECIRQKRIPAYLDKTGRQVYYFLDFYIPSLGLIIEIDGKGFHKPELDVIRDERVLQSMGLKTIRFDSKAILKKNFYKESLIPLLKNHSGEIEYLEYGDYKIEKINPKKFSRIDRRWDITVEEGESFVVSDFLVHNSGFMDELLAKNPHYSKSGNRFKAIPFDYSADTPKSQRTAFSAQMVNLVQAHLKKEGMHYKKLVTDRDGSPILGKIASYNIESPKPTAMSSTPALQALNVYQTMDANGETKKSFVAFRVISDKHAGTGKWIHPGLPAKLFMDRALQWAEKEWENKLLPEILNSIG